MDEIHVHKTKKSICAHFAESPCICLQQVFKNVAHYVLKVMGGKHAAKCSL